jgi:hypothetical protein
VETVDAARKPLLRACISVHEALGALQVKMPNGGKLASIIAKQGNHSQRTRVQRGNHRLHRRRGFLAIESDYNYNSNLSRLLC